MPTLSQYWFQNKFFGGPFFGWNQPYADGGWAWISDTGSSAATLVWNRPDNEEAIDVAAQLNSPIVLTQIDNLLGSQAQRTSGVMAEGMFWPDVPYYSKNPSRHNSGDMLVRVYFDFHINTPWYCTAADGNISYYLFLYLDGNGHLQGYVDGWSYDYSGGGPFCTGSINQNLNNAVPGGMSTVQGILDTALRLLSSSTFSMLYYLPGSGTKIPGSFNENADQDVAVAVLPE
jgi:hypothetical protein